jgi:GNAT superfamily N-acetyltransferase
MGAHELVERPPSAEELVELRGVTGLTPKSIEAARAAVPGTLFGVCVEADGRTVGIGRVIGDGGCWYAIVDVAVHPDHQGRGLGRRIVGALDAWISANAPDTAQAMLLADVPADALYEQFGYKRSAPGCIGMIKHFGVGGRGGSAE